MKKRYAIISVLVAPALLGACSGVLDLDPTDRFSQATVWGSETSIDTYIYGLYGIIKENSEIYEVTGSSRFNDAHSDLIKSPSWDQYNHAYNVTAMQESSFSWGGAGTFDCWSDCYDRIRRQNEFLRDCPSLGAKFGEEFVNTRMAEVRFIRAFTYFRLMRVYGCKEEIAKRDYFVSDDFKGGVIIRDVNESGSLDGPDQNDKGRCSWEEGWQFIISDLEFAAENLPTSWASGRATKAAAYALLSRIALYAEKWDVAIKAAEGCEALGCRLAQNYADVFSNSSINENLFVVNFVSGELTHRADIFFRPSGDKLTHKGGATIYGAFSPTSELVDSYEMADGTAFSWDVHGSDPYSGREPRFYASILYNGAEWEGRTIETYVDDFADDKIQDFTKAGSATSTVTGYYFKKWITEGDKTWEKNGSSHFFVMLRYAEVLLNKAEALAEADFAANKVKALAALNQVRDRVGLPAKDASTLEEFREILRHERIVELAGEGLRYWDIRRWRIAEDVLAGKMVHGVKITYPEYEEVYELDGDNEPVLDENGEKIVVDHIMKGEPTYTQIEVDQNTPRIFHPHYYSFSLPAAEISNNLAIGNENNNPGW